MKSLSCLQIGAALLACGFVGVAQCKEAAAPKPKIPALTKIDPAEITALMACHAKITGAMAEWTTGPDYKHFWMKDWKSLNDRFDWTVEVPDEGDYAVEMIIKDESRSGDPCQIELSDGASKLTHTVKRAAYWERQTFEGTIRLPAGQSVLSLRALALPPKGKLALFSLELGLPKVKSEIQKRAAATRANTDWMVQAKYGVMFHWTSWSKPRHGEPKAYADAVKDFDVEAFADMVKRTGAGFAVLTTSWAGYYFPAPIKAIDEIIPGRAAPRDLVGDLATALNKRGIKLILYYHPGHDDTPWWSKTGFSNEDKTAFFDLWRRIISEIGLRYGEKLAGWWFDDGITTYYPYGAPWEKMTEAARAGNPARVIAYNAWILPRATDFQDFACGEGDFIEFIGKEFVPKGGTGRFVGGPQSGLQGVITTMLEPGNWCHLDLDKEIAPPRFTKERLIGVMKGCMARRVVPMINMEAYQDGTTAPASVEVLGAMGEAIRGMKDAPEETKEDIGPREPKKGDVILEAADGKAQGQQPIYVENVDCFTYWKSLKAAAKWSFTAPDSGKYTVIATISAGHGPSEYQVSVGEQKLAGKIADTGGDPSWSDYIDDALGTVEVVKGQKYDVIVQATSMSPKGAPMNLRRVTLRPVPSK